MPQHKTILNFTEKPPLCLKKAGGLTQKWHIRYKKTAKPIGFAVLGRKQIS